MPDYQPMSTYPFAMNCSLLAGSLLYTFYGSKVSLSTLIVLTFSLQAVILLLLPISANIGGTVAYWLCFGLLFLFGLVSGLCQAACYSYNAMLPHNYIGIF